MLYLQMVSLHKYIFNSLIYHINKTLIYMYFYVQSLLYSIAHMNKFLQYFRYILSHVITSHLFLLTQYPPLLHGHQLHVIICNIAKELYTYGVLELFFSAFLYNICLLVYTHRVKKSIHLHIFTEVQRFLFSHLQRTSIDV